MTNLGILYIVIGCVLITLIICCTYIFKDWYNSWRRHTIEILKRTTENFYIKYVHETNKTKVCSAEDKDIIDFVLFLNKKLTNL